MRFVSALLLFSAALWSCAQQPTASNAAADSALQDALTGKWTGVLEYRDYSEPATSTKRVQLPTWLTVHPAQDGISFDYVYDDGPSKILAEHHAVLIDLKSATYRVTNSDAATENYSISGSEQLKNGRGTLVLSGEGKDAGKPAEIRTTLLVRRNLLSWLEEVRPAKSDAPFVFRHRYTFVRADVPTVTSTK